MELSEKLQLLRQKHQLTQEQLSEKLYVSRAAISKWESGRGYPNLDSLKQLSMVFSISLDELLSSDELIVIAHKERVESNQQLRSMVYSILDCMVICLVFFPLYGHQDTLGVNMGSLLSVQEPVYIITTYSILFAITFLLGIAELVFISMQRMKWVPWAQNISILLSLLTLSFMILNRQPYPAILVLFMLGLKSILRFKK